MYDVCIIGSGMIGSLTCLEICKNFPKKNIVFFNPELDGSASKAAGAMLNVFGEIDYGEQFDDYQNRKIDIGINAQNRWKKFFKENKNYKKAKTADDTIIYCKKNSTNLENKCFKEIKKYVIKHEKNKNFNLNKLKKLKKNILVKSDYALIKDEGAIDTNLFFKIISNELANKKNLKIINHKVEKIFSKNDYLKINFLNKSITTKKLVLSAGAFSKDILGNIGNKIQNTFFGIGSALEIKSNKKSKLYNVIPSRTVIRTPNRGSTCGIHIVPRNDNIMYLGAGSNISKIPNYQSRIGTVDYLLSSLKNEISNELDKDLMKNVIGFRPMSFDGKPLIGSLKNNPNIFYISGTKRDGLTYAPIISEVVIGWLEGNRTKLDNFFYDWHPDREPISYGNLEFSIEAYVQNKIAGLIEHDLVKIKLSRLRNQLYDEAYKMNKKIVKRFNLKDNFGIHPEILNVI